MSQATGERNARLVDWWSLTHVAWACALALVMPPLLAFALMVLWEPLEIFVLSPILARFGIVFGHEAWQNAATDIVFDGVGVLLAVWLVRPSLAAAGVGWG